MRKTRQNKSAKVKSSHPASNNRHSQMKGRGFSSCLICENEEEDFVRGQDGLLQTFSVLFPPTIQVSPYHAMLEVSLLCYNCIGNIHHLSDYVKKAQTNLNRRHKQSDDKCEFCEDSCDKSLLIDQELWSPRLRNSLRLNKVFTKIGFNKLMDIKTCCFKCFHNLSSIVKLRTIIEGAHPAFLESVKKWRVPVVQIDSSLFKMVGLTSELASKESEEMEDLIELDDLIEMDEDESEESIGNSSKESPEREMSPKFAPSVKSCFVSLKRLNINFQDAGQILAAENKAPPFEENKNNDEQSDSISTENADVSKEFDSFEESPSSKLTACVTEPKAKTTKVHLTRSSKSVDSATNNNTKPTNLGLNETDTREELNKSKKRVTFSENEKEVREFETDISPGKKMKMDNEVLKSPNTEPATDSTISDPTIDSTITDIIVDSTISDFTGKSQCEEFDDDYLEIGDGVLPEDVQFTEDYVEYTAPEPIKYVQTETQIEFLDRNKGTNEE